VALRPSRSASPPRRVGAAAATVLALLLAGGCQASTSSTPSARSGAAAATGSTPEASSGSSTSRSAAHAGPAHVSVSPSSASAHVQPDTTVAVRVRSGKLTSVTVLDARGGTISGGRSAGGTTWKAVSLLRPQTAYTVTVKAVGADGAAVTKVARFTTLTPKVSATYSLSPTGTVGVGMPVVVRFDSPVSSEDRAQVEKRVAVRTSPAQAGAWGWQDSSQLVWRPATYWKAGTTVAVSAAIQGVRTGKGKYVAKSDTSSFTVGDSMVSTVDIKTHMMTVKRNGTSVRTIPVSTGRPGATTETRSGTKVIMTREPVHVMDSGSIGIPKGTPGYYHVVAKWAMRITSTGEFLHSAPWSVSAQGHTNVSHGCTNLSPTNAKWLYDHSRLGDVVTFTGSSRRFTADEGIGVWTYSYSDWKARSALA